MILALTQKVSEQLRLFLRSVHPTASVAHGGAIAWRSLSRLSTAAWRGTEVAYSIAVFEPPSPLRMGFVAISGRHPHPRYGSQPQRWPVPRLGSPDSRYRSSVGSPE